LSRARSLADSFRFDGGVDGDAPISCCFKLFIARWRWLRLGALWLAAFGFAAFGLASFGLDGFAFVPFWRADAWLVDNFSLICD
jgi:hypothetical protein